MRIPHQIAVALGFAALLLAVFDPATVHAGGWTQPKGDYYTKVWARSYFGRSAFLTDGSTAQLPESYQDHLLNAYVEYGLLDQLTLVSTFSPIGLSVYGSETQAYMGPLSMGARYQILRTGRFVLAAQADLGGKFPVGDEPLGQGIVDGEPFVYRPTVGTAFGSTELQAGLGWSQFWLTGSALLRGFTNGDIDPGAGGFIQAGWKSSFGLVVDVHSSLYFSIGELKLVDVLGIANTRYVGLGTAVSYWFNANVAVQLAVDGALYAASNAATPSLMLGVELAGGTS